MLHAITTTTHPLLSFLKDDPVRPEIPAEFRVSNGRIVLVLGEGKPSAIVCVSFHNSVPVNVEDLHHVSDTPTTAVFYTIWSYVPGAGRTLLQSAVQCIKEQLPTVCRFVTLSPKTEMARRFHLKNGACILQENEATVNYEYIV